MSNERRPLPEEARELADIAAALRGIVLAQRESGLHVLPWKSTPQPASVPSPELSLDELAAVVARCTLCALHKGRTRTVFGTGARDARLMFIGEGPGRDEDLQGEPFVGAAGQLLTRIIGAIGLRRDQVYIANIVKCRPPNNRTPHAEEIASCRPYLTAQIDLIRPRIICTLGNVAAQAILETTEKISSLRGKFHRWRDILVMPTYHPAFLLRNPEKKRDVWEDMKMVQKELSQPDS